MSERPIFLTQDGLHKLQEELTLLRTVRRQKVAQRLHAAMAEGGELLDNAELEDARNEQAFVEGRIIDIENMLRNAVLIEYENDAGHVTLGSHVTVTEGSETAPETYHVVGSAEADPAWGKISNESPLGRALLGRKVGDEVVVHAPAGVLVFHIVGIE